MAAKDYDVVGYPTSRLATIDTGKIGQSTHYMFSLLEVDVTNARHDLRVRRQQHAMPLRSNRVIMFRDVDIALPVESIVDGVPVPLPLLIKAADRKSAQDIDREIRAAVSQPIADERDYILSGHTLSEAALGFYYRMPSWIRVLMIKRFIANPFRSKRHSGTVTVTTVNAIGRSSVGSSPRRAGIASSSRLGPLRRNHGLSRIRSK
jgi:hypothetical protein